MLMKISAALLGGICILLSVVIVSCHSGRKSAASAAPQPRFIRNVSIDPHNKSNVTHNAIDPRKYAVRQNPGSKTASKPSVAAKTYKLETPQLIKKKYAEIVGVTSKEIDNMPLYQFIDKWYGTNYRLGGSDGAGIDCSAFAQKLYAEVFGETLLRTAQEQFSNCKRLKHSHDVREGDLVFFHIHSKHITHVGVYLANNFFVHSSTTGGVMISSLNEEYWSKYYAGCGRVQR
jgi:cell wall-associated NlpC family hydrolase